MSNEFSTELVRVKLRTQALTELLPSSDKASKNALVSLKRVLDLEDRYKNTDGWYAAHVPLFIQVQNCVQSLVTHQTLAQVRGNGLIATATDSVRTHGSGLGKCIDSIESFLEVPNKAKREVINDILYPVADTFEQSKVMIERMYDNLIKRQDTLQQIKDAKDGLTDKPSDEDLKKFLTKPHWDEHKIRAYCIEYIARLFAFSIDEDQRESLVKNADYKLTDALDSLKPRFLLAA
jgi:hypothetical protein